MYSIQQKNIWPMIVLVIFALGVGLTFGYFIWNQRVDSVLTVVSETNFNQNTNTNTANANTPANGNGNVNSNLNVNSAANTNVGNAAELADSITLTAPKANASVASPITGTGQARGSWYFEASFPVRLEDAQGRVLAQTQAQAQGDWMTSNFVPYTFSLPFTVTNAQSVWLILQKDNPSGQTGTDQSLRVPVRL